MVTAASVHGVATLASSLFAFWLRRSDQKRRTYAFMSACYVFRCC
jgi:hypothetical protein